VDSVNCLCRLPPNSPTVEPPRRLVARPGSSSI
jgi:hypothetical protein